MHTNWPRAETPTHYHEDLNQAAKIATREMLNFIVSTKGLPREDVLMLLSAAMDLHVTQIVDGAKGCPWHVAEGDLPKGLNWRTAGLRIPEIVGGHELLVEG